MKIADDGTPIIESSDMMPFSEPCERGILASFFADKIVFSEFAGIITPEMFYGSARADMFAYMQETHCQDPVIIGERFPQNAMEIGEIMCLASNVNLCAHIDVLKDRYFRRKLIVAGQNLLNMARNDFDSTPLIIANNIQKTAGEVYESRKSHPEHIKEILPRVLIELHGAVDHGLGIRTGLIDVDDKLGGMAEGELIIVAGRPSMGKSSFALNVTRHNAIINKHAVLVFSLEMSKVLTTGRILFSEAMESWENAARGVANFRLVLPKITEQMTPVSEAPIIIDDTPGIGLYEIIAKARSVSMKYKIKLIIIDHIQLMGVKKGRSRNEEVSDISAGLKNLARDLNLPVMALSQLSRECEKRRPPIPMLSDLRDSGSIEQDADRVIFLYREEVYNANTKRANIADIIVAKNRNGRTGTVETRFDGKTMQFQNIVRCDDPMNPDYKPDARNQ